MANIDKIRKSWVPVGQIVVSTITGVVLVLVEGDASYKESSDLRKICLVDRDEFYTKFPAFEHFWRIVVRLCYSKENATVKLSYHKTRIKDFIKGKSSENYVKFLELPGKSKINYAKRQSVLLPAPINELPFYCTNLELATAIDKLIVGGHLSCHKLWQGKVPNFVPTVIRYVSWLKQNAKADENGDADTKEDTSIYDRLVPYIFCNKKFCYLIWICSHRK